MATLEKVQEQRHKENTERIVVLEHTVAGIQNDVSQIRLISSETRDAVLSMPKATSVSDRMKTVAATVAVVAAFLAWADNWLANRVEADRQTLARIERYSDDLPVLKYRLDLAERALSKTITALPQ